ncbi:MAG TPA: hypothetical protein DIT26_03450 [Mesotoga infera]|jgi:hypothetical protein|uniref:N-acylglucosamine-6-phosphate 2-epimerase n=1 Tax=Mesotoga infera TaxID=1236046 RepID=A0A3D3TKE2_9BACT|nr:hypothetical protein [Mesotoga infera]
MHFRELMDSKGRLLVVSLPENSLEYARAAVENGADAIKLHINVKHRVTGKAHVTWTDVRETVKYIYSTLGCCMGIVPGAEAMASEDELREMGEFGLSFFDVYVDYAPLYVLKNDLCKMLALNHTYCRSMASHLKRLGADAVEISIIDPKDYGKDLSLEDLLKYLEVLELSGLPSFIPTQKRITVDDADRILSLGFKGLIIGPIVTGTDIESFSRTVRKFSKIASD